MAALAAEIESLQSASERLRREKVQAAERLKALEEEEHKTEEARLAPDVQV